MPTSYFLWSKDILADSESQFDFNGTYDFGAFVVPVCKNVTLRRTFA